MHLLRAEGGINLLSSQSVAEICIFFAHKDNTSVTPNSSSPYMKTHTCARVHNVLLQILVAKHTTAHQDQPYCCSVQGVKQNISKSLDQVKIFTTRTGRFGVFGRGVRYSWHCVSTCKCKVCIEMCLKHAHVHTQWSPDYINTSAQLHKYKCAIIQGNQLI